MAKVRGSLADISTSFDPLEPDTYPVQIKKFDLFKDEETGREHYEVIMEVIDGEYRGRKLYDRIWMHKKDPPYEENSFGKVKLKRYFEAVVGDRANADGLDTDELLDGTVLVELSIENYTDRNDKDKKRNNIEMVAPLP